MRQYRYRTKVLIGPWRRSPDAAIADAVRAGQAAEGQNEPEGVRWIVPGSIEERVVPPGAAAEAAVETAGLSHRRPVR